MSLKIINYQICQNWIHWLIFLSDLGSRITFLYIFITTIDVKLIILKVLLHCKNWSVHTGNHTKIGVTNTLLCHNYYITPHFLQCWTSQLCQLYMENCFRKWVMSDTYLHMQWTNEHTTKNMQTAVPHIKLVYLG